MRNRIFVSIFAVMLALLTLLTVFLPKKEFSDNENRVLASFPTLSIETLKDGSFTSDFSLYVADHFAFRDVWVSIKSIAETATLKTSNNDVFNGKDGYLLDSFVFDDDSQFEENLNAVKEFEKIVKDNYDINVKTLIAPTATQIHSDKLPPFAVTSDGEAMISHAAEEIDGFINVYSALDAHKDEYIYYKTDHHWTDLGAYYAYEQYKSALGETAPAKEEIDTDTVSLSFFGTTYSRFGRFFGVEADTLFAPSQEYIGSMTVTDSKGNTTNSIYHPEKLSEKDKYLYFLGGNDSIVTIDTENKNGKTLLLLKDSYANSFLPYIIGDFEKIIVIDMRYYPGLINYLIEDSAVTDILILYNIKSFAEDQYIQFITLTE